MRPLFFLFLLVGVPGIFFAQSTEFKHYATEFDSLYKAYQDEAALKKAAEWDRAVIKKYGENSVERALPLADSAWILSKLLSKYHEANPLYEKSIQLMELAKVDSMDAYAFIVQNFGLSKWKEGKIAESIVLLEKAVNARNRWLGADHLLTLKANGSLAYSYYTGEKYALAEAKYQSGIATLERLKLTDNTLYMEYLRAFAELLTDENRFSKALDYREKCIIFCQKKFGTDHEVTHQAHYGLSRTLYAAGRMDEAEPIIQELVLVAKPKIKYLSLSALGTVQLKLGLLEEALVNMEQYLQFLKQPKEYNPTRYATVCVNIADIFYLKNELGKADSLRIEALETFAKMGSDTSSVYLNILLSRAYSAVRQNPLDEAQLFLEKINAQYQPQINADSLLTETWLMLNGWLAFRKSDYLKAYDFFTRCSNVLRLESDNRPDNLKLRAMAALELNKLEEVRSIFQELFALNQSKAQKNFSILSDRERQQFFKKFKSTGDFLATVQMQKPTTALEETLTNLQLFSKNILEKTTRKTQDFVQNSSDSSLHILHQQWLDAHDKVNFAYHLSPEKMALRGLDLNKLESEANDLEKALVRKGVPMIQKTKEPEWTDIRDNLRDSEAAVDVMRFQVFKNDLYQDTAVYVFSVIKPGATRPELIFLENGNEIESFVAGQYQNEITQKKELSANLYQKMWAPVAAHLQGVKTVYFSPDGIFHKINLNTLRAADGTYVLDNIQIKQVTNLRNLLDRGQENTGSEPGMAVMFGNPAFKTGANSAASSTPADLTSRTPLYRDIAEDAKGDFHLSPLPGSEREVNAIAQKLTGKNWQTAVFTGAQATEDTLKKLKSPKVLHIATHGYFLNFEKTSSAIGFTSSHAGKNPAFRGCLNLKHFARRN